MLAVTLCGCAEPFEEEDGGRVYTYVDAGPEPERGPSDYCTIAYGCDVVDRTVPISTEEFLDWCVPWTAERWDPVESRRCEIEWDTWPDCYYADCVRDWLNMPLEN